MADIPRTPSQTSVMTGLICFGIIAIVLGAMNLRRVFSPRPVATGPASYLETTEQFEERRRLILAAQDTDGEGLSDFDELERTHTSPFLADSDSDGKSDKEEIDAGQDPNCPTGKTCGAIFREEEVPQRVQPVVVPGAPVAPSDPSRGLLEPDGSPATPGRTLSAQELRAALQQQGVPKDLLNTLSDADLEASYGRTIRSITTLPTGESSPFGGALIDAFSSALQGGRPDLQRAVEQLPNTPNEIRQLLRQGGIPQQQLDRLSDAELLDLWNSSTAEVRAQQGSQ